jgi:hypothetical protein
MKAKYTPAEFAAKMREVQNKYRGDSERAHIWADDLLMELLASLGYGEGVDVFNDMDKWYA